MKRKIKDVQYLDSSDKKELYTVFNKVRNEPLFGEYGSFVGTFLHTHKKYIDKFPLFFETEKEAKIYLEEFINFYNAFQDEEYLASYSDFEIRKTIFDNSGKIMKIITEEE